ncbi:CDP-diacylglycerol--serine O-phosphatidyltransferase [Reticulomyxa filosa]|uniref:CDP-diacylglycerol--serine O-phosphatidyltransferase n=1 Tax=Reticulomyxa filosa TaxID=46433 RepID=X6NTA6_RETFI|nr:CDP-diacylglycerol--serine O-phosphatidyltransferase [Reticulomyxa filosa]|eukprot:ETO29236.1 CDP-diacylglycerol--serine O-phosphatidyltransferase [Reticulomyxa filosa]
MSSLSILNLFREFSIADWITLLNAFCGVSAILFWNDNKLPYLDMSFFMFPIALIADIMDGQVARQLKKTSIYGGDLDSLSDVISFGVAPCVMAFTLGVTGMWDVMCLCFNVLCGVSRLARFNVTSASMRGDKFKKMPRFEGLPIPGNLSLVVLLAIDHYFLNYFLTQKFKFRILGKHFHPIVSILYVVFGFLMISKVKLPHLIKNSFKFSKKKKSVLNVQDYPYLIRYLCINFSKKIDIAIMSH